MASKVLKTLTRRRLTRVFTAPRAVRSLSTRPQGAQDGAGGGADRKTHFGFESVREEEKVDRVYEVFENVAEKYDVMNDAMSVGIHRLWKDAFIERLGPTAGTRLVDVAGGTGDIAFRFLDYVQNTDPSLASSKDHIDVNIGNKSDFSLKVDNEYYKSTEEDEASERPSTHVTVCDINQAMLDVGKQRAQRLGHLEGMSWLKGNAECLPLEDETFDAYTIAFGIRNVTHIDKVLDEAYRVLKPGGRFMCLEFSQVTNPLLRSLYDQYSFQVIPVLGQLIAQDWKSYQYLVESIRKFPVQEDFADMIREAGFSAVTYENLTFGVAAIHSGFKL